jgi:amino acid transporter
MNKVKRISAIVGIVLIASLYFISFLSAFLATEYSNGLFLASIFSTIVIPIMIWWFITIYKWVHRNDPPENPENSAPDKGKSSEK